MLYVVIAPSGHCLISLLLFFSIFSPHVHIAKAIAMQREQAAKAMATPVDKLPRPW